MIQKDIHQMNDKEGRYRDTEIIETWNNDTETGNTRGDKKSGSRFLNLKKKSSSPSDSGLQCWIFSIIFEFHDLKRFFFSS